MQARAKIAEEQRDARRKHVLMAGLIVFDRSHHSLDCTICDLSEGGARITLPRGTAIPDTLYLINVRDRSVHQASVAWRGDLEVGLSFHQDFALSEITDPNLVFLRRLWLSRATR